MFQIILFLVGFGLSIIGFMYIIAYLNYLTIGYTFWEYLALISTKLECFLALIGMLIISIVIIHGGKT